MSSSRIAVCLEVTPTQTAPPRSTGPAGAGPAGERAALEALAGYAERYAPVAEHAGVSFPSTVTPSMSSSGCPAGLRRRSPHPNAAAHSRK